jgi:hypothetical protein
LAGDGKVVYHGHLGHELLSGIRHALKVLLTAPMEFRIEQVRARQSIAEGSARHYIEEIDKARGRRLMTLFGADWRDANRYDLVLNMSKMSREGARRLIVEAAKLEEYHATPASNEAFNDLALGSRVLATLLAADVQVAALDIRADAGHIRVRGRVEEGMEYEVVKLVQDVPGVIKITTDLYSVPPEGVLRI